MSDGIEEGLRLLSALEERRALPGYYLLPAAQADLLRRSGCWRQAEDAYGRALELVGNDAERRFLERRMAEVRRRLEDGP
jgi:RNA polymerase sigma-70 factor, ECF subfamily